MTKMWIDTVFSMRVDKEEAKKYCYHVLRSDRCQGLISAETFVILKDYIIHHK